MSTSLLHKQQHRPRRQNVRDGGRNRGNIAVGPALNPTPSPTVLSRASFSVDPLAVQRQMSTLRAADTLRAQQDAARAAALRETVSAWGNQTKETRREWPIQDPTALSREQLPRSVEPVYETQRPSSVSGCQTFGGEWREDPRLKQAARAELRTGLATGRFENSQKRAAQQDDKAAAAAAQRTMYAAVTTMAAAAEREAAWAKRNMVVENATLADTVRATAAAQTAKEEALKTAHVQIQEANPMLREDTRQGLFVNAPHRCVVCLPLPLHACTADRFALPTPSH